MLYIQNLGNLLSDHQIKVRVLMLRFFLMASEGEGEGQGADTSDVHIQNEHYFGHCIPFGADARGEAAGGEGRRGLENGVLQRGRRLYQSEHKDGNQDKREGHRDNGTGLVHQLVRDGLVLEFDVLLALYRGPYRLQHHEEGGGLDATARGTRRAPNEHQNDDHYH